MNKSESIINLSKALLKFQSSINSISKDAVNPFLKNKYASLANILDSINEHLQDNGIVIMQPPVGMSGDMVTLRTMLIHAESGEFMESEFSMVPAKKDPQGIGSCITYMRRYAITSILKLNVDDDDGNEASNVGKNGGKAGRLNEELGLTSGNGDVKYKSENIPEVSIEKIARMIAESEDMESLNKVVPIIGKNVKDSNAKTELRSLFQLKKGVLLKAGQKEE